MGRLLGRSRSKPDNEIARKNEIVAEIKKEHPYIGPVALQQEVMKRMAQQESDNNHQNCSSVATTAANTKEDFAPQRILFKRNKPKNRQRQKSSETNITTSLTQSINKSFIDFLSSSTNSHNTVKTSNVVGGGTAVIPGRRTSTHAQGEDDAYVHMAAQQMRDMELSDSEEEDDEAGGSGSSNRRSSAGSSSLREKMRKRFSSKAKRHRRTSSANSSITTNSAQDNNSSDNDSTKPLHKSEEQNNYNNNSNQKIEGEEKEIMDFVEKFLADGGSVNPKTTPRATESRRSSYTIRRRSTLCSVEENKALVTSGESVNRSITSLGSKCSTSDTNSRAGGDDSLICSWGRRSLNDSELVGGDGELICNWDSRQSVLSNTSSTARTSDAVLCSTAVIATDTPTYPREINVGIKGDINS